MSKYCKNNLLKPNKNYFTKCLRNFIKRSVKESILLPILPSFVTIRFSLVLMALSCTYQLAQFTASPFIGLMSDRYGRRPITLFCITGSIIGIAILSFTVLFD